MRNLIYAVAFAATLAGMGSTTAQTYPARPITMIVPYPAGGLFDAVARVLAEPLRGALSQTVVIENVGGAGGSIGIDGYQLISGVASNQRYPKTFKIPPEDARRSVSKGNVVKLHFEIFDREMPDDPLGARMWVEIASTDGPYFIGKLLNKPVIIPSRKLRLGTKVVFLPEHVLNIDYGKA